MAWGPLTLAPQNCEELARYFYSRVRVGEIQARKHAPSQSNQKQNRLCKTKVAYTFAVILQTSILIAISLTERSTNLNSHILSIEISSIEQSIRRARILEAARILERSVRAARRLRLAVSGINTRKERRSCDCGSNRDRPKVQHREGSSTIRKSDRIEQKQSGTAG